MMLVAFFLSFFWMIMLVIAMYFLWFGASSLGKYLEAWSRSCHKKFLLQWQILPKDTAMECCDRKKVGRGKEDTKILKTSEC